MLIFIQYFKFAFCIYSRYISILLKTDTGTFTTFYYGFGEYFLETTSGCNVNIISEKVLNTDVTMIEGKNFNLLILL